MRRYSIVLATGVAALVASLLIGPAATAKPERPAAGTVVIGHDQEPDILNGFLTAGNAFTTALAVNPVLAYGAIYNEKAKLVPYLLDGLRSSSSRIRSPRASCTRRARNGATAGP